MADKLRVKIPRIMVDAIGKITEDAYFKLDYQMTLDSLKIHPDSVDRDMLRDDLSEIMHSVIGNMLAILFEDLAHLMLETQTEYGKKFIDWKDLPTANKLNQLTIDEDGETLDAKVEEVEADSADTTGEYLTHHSNILGTMGHTCREIYYSSFYSKEDDMEFRKGVADLGNYLLDHDAVSFDYDSLITEIIDREINSFRSLELRTYEVDDFTLVSEFTPKINGGWIDNVNDTEVEWGMVERELDAVARASGDMFVLVNHHDIYIGEHVDKINDLPVVESIGIMEAN